MTKGARTIVVNNQTYKWSVSSDGDLILLDAAKRRYIISVGQLGIGCGTAEEWKRAKRKRSAYSITPEVVKNYIERCIS